MRADEALTNAFSKALISDINSEVTQLKKLQNEMGQLSETMKEVEAQLRAEDTARGKTDSINLSFLLLLASGMLPGLGTVTIINALLWNKIHSSASASQESTKSSSSSTVKQEVITTNDEDSNEEAQEPAEAPAPTPPSPVDEYRSEIQSRLDGLASSEVGNGGEKYIDWFYSQYGGLTPQQMQNYGWCDRFTSWTLAQSGITLNAGGCDGQAAAFGQNYHSLGDGYTPQNGDVVFLDYGHDGGRDHVGIYYEIDGQPYLLHGNWGNRVQVSSLDSSTGMGGTIREAIVGYGDSAALIK